MRLRQRRWRSGGGSACGSVSRAKKIEVGEEVRGGNGGVVEAESKVWFGGVPFPKKVSGELRYAPLVSGDVAIRE